MLSNRSDSISTIEDSRRSQSVYVQRSSENVKIESSLIYARVKKMIDRDELIPEAQVSKKGIGNIFKLEGDASAVQKSKEMIMSVEQKLKSQLIRKQLELTQQEINYYIKKETLQKKIKEFCKKQKCKIEVIKNKVSSQNLIASTLSYENKELHIAYADISKFPCDAIVNSWNNLMSLKNVDIESGVAKNIFDMAGPSYSQFCESYIQENKTLEFGKAITYQMPAQLNGIQKYIINVQTPIYDNGKQTNEDYVKIENNIKAIFAEANKYKIKTLALPIFGGGACGYYFKQIAQNVINYIINALYSQDNKIVQKVYIVELKKIKLNDICQILRKLVEKPKQEIRQVKYQWQWDLNDYDDEEINREIDEKYEEFQQSQIPCEMDLIFPYTKHPGTHHVDLKSMIIKDKDLGDLIKLSIQSEEGNESFLFDDEKINEALNEYMMSQKQNNKFEFEIFNKQQKISFQSIDKIVQLNKKTGFSRDVTKIPYQKNQQQAQQNILIGKNTKLEQNIDKIQQKLKDQNQIFVQSFDLKVIGDVQTLIQKKLNKKKSSFNISLPIFKDEDFSYLQQFITEKALEIQGVFTNGSKIIISAFEGRLKQIKKFIDDFMTNKIILPAEWTPQTKNFEKVELPNDSEEFKTVQTLYQKTEKGKIHKIYRLQNLRFWKNYQQEQEHLRESSLDNCYTLTDVEQERYLWHGVREQHPKIIYQDNKEAFDITFSSEGNFWGKGIYFAERADYSRGYSYQLQQQDNDPLHVGKRVMLLCKVATGRVHICESNTQIKRPPKGYDCVGGDTQGSNVFILYDMNVRQAYPAYEIIFE